MDKKKALVFSALIPLAILIFPSVYAEPFVTFEQSPTYDKTLISVNPDNSRTYKFESYATPRILDDSNNYQKYIFTNHTDYLQVETTHGSVRLDKTSCAFEYYPKGRILNNSPLFTDSIIARNAINGTSNWQAVTTVNTAACVASWDGESLEAKKNKPGTGTLFYRYVNTGLGWKTELEVINLTALTNRKFAFTQTIDLNRDTIKFGDTIRNIDNYHNQTFDRAWIESHQAKLLDLMNGFNFDFDLAYENLWAISVYDTGEDKSKLSFDFARNASILLPNESRLYDPTFGPSLAANEGSVYPSAGTGTDCTARTGNSVPASITITKNTGVTNCQIYWGQFDISSVPSSSTASSGYFEYDQSATSNWIDTCRLRSYSSNPTGLSTADKYSQGWTGTGLGSVTCNTDGNDRQITLNSTGISDLNTKIASGAGWWAASLQGTHIADATVREFGMVAGNQYLSFVYTTVPKPHAVTDLTATAVSKTEIFLDWTQPNLNTGTLSGYQINKTTSSPPNTILVNNTLSSTSEYTATGLTQCTLYYFRVSAWTQYGNNATGNIANATTACFTPPSAPTLSATAQSDTAVRFTSVNGTTGDFNIAWYGLRCVENSSGPWVTIVSNSSVPSPRVYVYSGLTIADTVTCQWRDGSAAGWSPWSNNATDNPELDIIEPQRGSNSDRLTRLAAWFDSMGGVYMGMGLFPFLVMMIGLLARPRTTHIFVIITLSFMGILHGSGYYQYPDWYWALSLLFGIVIVLARVPR